MSKNMGYISVHRSIWDHWLWDDKPFSKGQAWIDLLMLANHKEDKFVYKDQVMEGKRGTVYRSLSFLAERWGWGRDKVSRFLKQLESDGMVAVHTSTHRTTITISNYAAFQDNLATSSATDGSTGRKQVGSKSAGSRRKVGTYNNDNNSNKVNKVNKKASADAGDTQTPEELAAAEEWFNSLEDS